MRQENNLNESRLRSGLIGDLVYGIFSNTLDLVAGAVEHFIQDQQKRIFKKVSILVVFFIGVVFLLNSLALFVSVYLDKAPWVGYGVVGGVLTLLALIFWKE